MDTHGTSYLETEITVEDALVVFHSLMYYPTLIMLACDTTARTFAEAASDSHLHDLVYHPKKEDNIDENLRHTSQSFYSIPNWT